jgi:Ca2+-binding RTX toxin-like protein
MMEMAAGDTNVGSTPICGAGDDFLAGNAGSDIYVWSLGDGNDTINDYDSSGGSLVFGEGISPLDVALSRIGNDAVFAFGGAEGSVAVQNWYSHEYYQLAGVGFADGASWTRADINAMAS